MNDENEEIEKDELYYHLLDKFSFTSEEMFYKYYKGIRLGYLLACLDEEEF